MLQPQTPHTLDFWLEVEEDAKAQAGGQCSAGGASEASAGADKGTCRSAAADDITASSGSDADGSTGSGNGSGGDAGSSSGSSSGGDAADSDDAMGDLPLGLHIELTVTFLDRTPELLAAKARLPPWTAEIFLATAYFSQWDF